MSIEIPGLNAKDSARSRPSLPERHPSPESSRLNMGIESPALRTRLSHFQ